MFGNSTTYAYLGRCTYKNKQSNPFTYTVIRIYKKAAKQGDVDAQVLLGIMYLRGEKVLEDYVEAYAWLNLAAVQDGEMAELASKYIFRIELRMTHAQVAEAQALSLDLASRISSSTTGANLPLYSAQNGHAGAQFNLGVMYANGKGVPKNDVEALKWYWRAAEQGYAKAQYSLGRMYYEGYGVPQDFKEAFKWCQKAAEQGDAQAQAFLGQMYFRGKGVQGNYVEAYAWTNLAVAQAGYLAEKSSELKSVLQSIMTRAQVAEAQARSIELASQISSDSSGANFP